MHRYYIIREWITDHGHRCECLESSTDLEASYYRLDELSALGSMEGATHVSLWCRQLGDVFSRHLWTESVSGGTDWRLIASRVGHYDSDCDRAISDYRQRHCA